MILQKMGKNTPQDFEGTAQASPRDQVRDLVSNLLQHGKAPQEIAEMLTYTAVEMSLHLAENKLCVLPILMSSMTQAAHAYAVHLAEQNKAELEVELCESTNATFH